MSLDHAGAPDHVGATAPAGSPQQEALPEAGLDADRVRALLTEAASADVAWREGRSWSLVYDVPGHHDLVLEAATRFLNENGLSHSAFPSASRFEAAVIAMVASVVAPGRRPFGTFSAGGTESTMLAVKAYRDAPERRGDTIVLPVTAHPSFGKAAHYLGLRLRTVPVEPSGAVDPARMAEAMDDDTMLLAASAPNFPYGAVDPIAALGALAAEHGIGLHVDAALGGLFLPFLDAAGGSPPRFGLDVPGVTSLSVDLHKYGYGAKGASVLLFATEQLRHASYYVATGWPGGAYAQPTVLGTRPVGAAAAAFASMVALGRSGYRDLVERVMATTRRLQQGLRAEGFEIVGDPAMSVFAAAPGRAPLPAVAGGMEARGWRIDAQDSPPSIHFSVFPRHEQVAERFLADLSDVLAALPERLPDDAPVSSYGVMVRGGSGASVDDAALLAHLDARFEDRWWADTRSAP